MDDVIPAQAGIQHGVCRVHWIGNSLHRSAV